MKKFITFVLVFIFAPLTLFLGEGCSGGFSPNQLTAGKTLATSVTPPVISPSPSPTPQPGGFNGSPNIPNPPNTVTLVGKIQTFSGWSAATGAVSQCPDGVASPTCIPVNANYNPTVGHASDPVGLTGSDATTGEFQLFPSPAYTTAIWGHSVVTNANARNFIWDFEIYVDAANYGSSELDLYTSLNNGQRFMMGSQCDRNTNAWDTWSEAEQKWIGNPSIACNQILTPGVWHHVTFYNTIDSTKNTYTYQVLRIDNVDYVLNQTQSTKQVGWPNGLIGVQVQLDTNSSGQGVNQSIENMRIYAW